MRNIKKLLKERVEKTRKMLEKEKKLKPAFTEMERKD